MVQPLIAGYQERAQKDTNELKLLQELSKKLGGEYTTLVQQELDILEEESKVFKLIGMALVPQSLEESRSNINSRLEFLKQGSAAKEKELRENKDKQIKIQENLMKLEHDFKSALQSMMQSSQPGQGK